MMACRFCDAMLYIKVTRYAKPIAAPLTEADALRQRLMDLTGEDYVMLPAQYCPMCGERKQLETRH